MKRKRKQPVPIMLLWSRADQRRFIDAVEELVALVGDLRVELEAAKRRRRPRRPAEAAPPNGA